MDNKQNTQDKITPASHGDELDVLEAVYRVGNSRNTNVLSSEQVQILKDSGRITDDGLAKNLTAGDLLIYAVEDSIVEVLIKNDFYTREQWENKSEELRRNLLKVYAQGMFGIELEDWILKVKNKTKGT